MKNQLRRMRGVVVHGKGRGKGLGFPTANIVLNGIYPVRNKVSNGVYAAWVYLREERFPAAVSVGANVTFGEKERTIEAHLLDFSGDMFGENVEIEFVKRVRAMEKFGSVEKLVERMEKDVREVRRSLRVEFPLLTGEG